MDIVVSSIVGEDPVNWVPRELIAAVIQDCFDSGYAEEPPRLPYSHTSDEVGKTGTERIKQETFNRVVVEGTVCIRYV